LIGIGQGCNRWWWRCGLIAEGGSGGRCFRVGQALGQVGVSKYAASMQGCICMVMEWEMVHLVE
jgi:hypothetical protein